MPTAHASRLMALAVLAVGCGREAPAGFAGSASCAECHAAESGAWTGSDHQRAMQVADSATVLADFSSGMLVHFGDTTRMRRDGADWVMNARGADGTHRDFRVCYTFGIRPLQQYVAELPGGRYGVLPPACHAPPPATAPPSCCDPLQ